MEDLRAAIEGAWERRDTVGLDTKGPVREAVEAALNLLDSGKARVAEKVAGDNSGTWRTNQWLKKAVLLSFRLADNGVMAFGSAGAPAFGMGVVGACLVELCLRGRLDADVRPGEGDAGPQAVLMTIAKTPTGEPALDALARIGAENRKRVFGS